MKKSVKYLLGLGLIAVSQISTSFADTGEPSDWYLHLDVNGLQNSVLRKNTDSESREGIKFLKVLFGDKFFDKIQYVTAYGDMKQNDESKTLLIQGNFTGSKKQFLNRLQELGFNNTDSRSKAGIYSGNLKTLIKNFYFEAQKAGLTDSSADFKLSKLDDKQNIDKIIYTAFTPSNQIVFSNVKAKVEAWVKGDQQIATDNSQGLFEVVVDIQEAMMHAGVNLDDEVQAFNFESISAKQLSQVSVSYNESGPDSELQLGLSAETTATATKIQSVVKGLIALKSLTVNDPLITNLLANVRYEQNAGELKVIMSGSVDAFRSLIQSND